MKQQQLPQQQLPVLAHQFQQPVPIKLAAGAVEYVRDVGAVEALAESDEQLGGDQFLRPPAPAGIPRTSAGATLDPGLIDGDDAVAHAGDQVDEEAVPVRLGQPTGSRPRFRTLPLSGSAIASPTFSGGQEQIKVFGIAPDSGMSRSANAPETT